ncbi:DUF3592 domain-containing protein [Hymenobacter citatus]|uniref:DUF3592 domain-containing protein n=1 Tax=Hymenobacter citatus TaxID=2763506 RepID=UPI003CCE0766
MVFNRSARFVLYRCRSELLSVRINSREKTSRALEAPGLIAHAVIIDRKNFFGNSSVSHQFSYSFRVNGRDYTGNSRNPIYKIGDTVKVRYIPHNPEYNGIVE